MSPYTKFLIENITEGDEITVSSSKLDSSYHGKILKITDKDVHIKNTLELGFFESLAYPAMEIVPLKSIWWFNVKKQDGTEIYR